MMTDRLVAAGVALIVHYREESVTLGRPAEAVALRASPDRLWHGRGGDRRCVRASEQAIRARRRTLAGVLATRPAATTRGGLRPAAGEAAQSGGTE